MRLRCLGCGKRGYFGDDNDWFQFGVTRTEKIAAWHSRRCHQNWIKKDYPKRLAKEARLKKKEAGR